VNRYRGRNNKAGLGRDRIGQDRMDVGWRVG